MGGEGGGGGGGLSGIGEWHNKPRSPRIKTIRRKFV